ncbi:hypothetical protein [Streptomyces mirabilis]|uniref:hypothetical protein n=1 Tax=Streptomyces mirabilis TaxID=68239 RepID=UPI00369E7A28
MTTTTHAPASVPAAIHPAYDPTPSIPRLITELVQEDFWARYAQVRGDAPHFDADYLANRKRTALLLRAVIADIVALAAPGNTAAAADAASAANAVRSGDWRLQLPAEAARTWLRDQYLEWQHSEAPHPPNCPGGCRGSGLVMQAQIWQDDGVAVHAEPSDCLRGEEPDPHGPDCRCHGDGRRWNAERREYALCDIYTPNPAYEPPQPVASDDPWSTGPYRDERPF